MKIDLQKIKIETHKSEKLNWEFRSWLKFHAPGDIDSTVSELSRKYSSQINCQECANCCETLKFSIQDHELKPLAKTCLLSLAKFKEKFTEVYEDGDLVFGGPCPMLKNKSCSIYKERPETCRTYPHLEKPDFLHRLIGVINNLSVCPIAFYTFEELKTVMKWRRPENRRGE